MGSLSSKSSSSESSGSFGDCWKNEIYFDPEADQETGKDYHISDDELKNTFAELINVEDRVEKIWVYSHRLYPIQLIQGIVMHHAFVVLESNQWYWSIEKNTEGITIQRCKKLEYVRGKYRRGNRLKPVTLRKSGEGNSTLKDLVNWLYFEDELNKEYNVFNWYTNCQGFAERVFNHFATNVKEYFVL